MLAVALACFLGLGFDLDGGGLGFCHAGNEAADKSYQALQDQ
jgi:hypothetical protein